MDSAITPALVSHQRKPQHAQVVAVILMDIGIWNNNSILASQANLNATITPNTPVTNFLQKNASFIPAGWCSLGVSSASLLGTDPDPFTIPVAIRTPAVIA